MPDPLSAQRVALPPAVTRYAIAGIAGVVAIWTAVSPAYDFRVYWEAGRRLTELGWAGVYDPASLTPFKYHPIFALGFAPWGFLPWLVARIAWAALNGLLLFDAQRRWVRDWGFDAAAIAMGFVGVVHALTWQTKLGNVTIVMLWAFTVALTARSAWIRSAMYGLLLTLKPYWLVLLLPWALGRKWRTALGAALAVMLLSLAPALFGVTGAVDAYQSWFATIADPSGTHNYPKLDNQGWYALLSRHEAAIGSLLPWLWFAGCAAVALLWLLPWLRRDPADTDLVAEARREWSIVPVLLWSAPLSWMHHQMLLWPLLTWLWIQGRTERASRVVWVLSWMLLNGTGRTVAGRDFSRTLLRLGLPILSYPLLAWWSGRRTVRKQGPAL